MELDLAASVLWQEPGAMGGSRGIFEIIRLLVVAAWLPARELSALTLVSFVCWFKKTC